MRTIAFWMLHEEGHLLPTFRLASALRARGHRVCYFALPDQEDMVVENGFEHVPIFEEMYPRGELARERRLDLAGVAARDRELVGLLYHYHLDGLTDALLHRVAPDLLLCDVLNFEAALVARHWQIPVLTLCTSLPQTPDPGIPPLASSLPFDDSPAGIAAAERAWAAHVRGEADIELLYARMRAAVQRHYRVPAGLLDPRGTFVDHMVGFPQLVLCTPALDYPRPPAAWRHYGESLWMERREPAFPWHALDPDRPLVFCSLGTQSHRQESARRFLGELLAAAARAPAWQFAIALGARLTAADFDRIPDNALLVSHAPQLALLHRSRLAITHGGLGTLKECMFLGVPVLVFPGLFDQPGNAARVEYHGLGRTGDIHTVTASEILTMARQVLDDPAIPRRIAAVQRSLRALEETQPGLALAEAMLAGR